MSLLLRHLQTNGPLAPADLEAAARRQQQAGGSLDTALLELGLMKPADLDACLQAACGLPGPPVRLLERGPTRPWDHVPKDLLDIGWALPLAVEDGKTIVAVHPELPDAKLGQLFRQIRGFHPVVAPECCLAKIAAERSGAILAPRYALLVLDYLQALRGDGEPPTAPPSQPPAADAPGPAPRPAASPAPSAPVAAASPSPATPAPVAPVPEDKHAPTPVAPVPAASSTPAPVEPVPAVSPAPVEPVLAASPAPVEPVPAASPAPAPVEPVPAASPAAAPTTRRRAEAGPASAAPRVGAPGSSASPSTAQRLEAARAALAGARERDRITEALVRAAVIVAPRVALFGVKREGLRVLAAPGSALRLSEGLVIPLPEGGLLDRAVTGLGPLHLLIEPSLSFAVGQPLGIPCVFEPVLAGGRTVLMLYVDRAGVAFDPSERQLLRELCDTARRSLEALLRLLGWVVPPAQTSPSGQGGPDRSRPATRPHLAAPVIPVEVPEIAVPAPAPVTVPVREDSRPAAQAAVAAAGEPPAPAPSGDSREATHGGGTTGADEEPVPEHAGAGLGESLEAGPGDSSASRSRGSLRASRGRAIITLVNPIRRDEPATVTPLPLRLETSETRRAGELAADAPAAAAPASETPAPAEPAGHHEPAPVRPTGPGLGLSPVPVPLGPDSGPDMALVARFAALVGFADSPAPTTTRPEEHVVENLSAQAGPVQVVATADPAPRVDLPGWIAAQEPSGIEEPLSPAGPPADAEPAPFAAVTAPAPTVGPDDLAASDAPPAPAEPPPAAPAPAEPPAPVAAPAPAEPPAPAPVAAPAVTGPAPEVLVAVMAPTSAPAPEPVAAPTSAPEPVAAPTSAPAPEPVAAPTSAPAPEPVAALEPTTMIPHLIAPPGTPGAGRRRRPVEPRADEPVLVIPKTLRRTTELSPHPMARRADPAAGDAPILSMPTTLIGPRTGRRRGKAEPPPEVAEPALNMPRLVRDAEPADTAAKAAPPPAPASSEHASGDMAVPPGTSGHVPQSKTEEERPGSAQTPAGEPAAPVEVPTSGAKASDDEIDAEIEAFLHDPAGTGLTRLRAFDARGLARLAARFPGPIDLANATNFPPPSAHGPLLRACVELGPVIGPHVLPLFSSVRPQIRFYAAFLFQELRDPRCLRSLGELAFDADPDVRLIATRVLESYSRAPEFAAVAAAIRAELDSRDRDRQLLAVEAAGTLRDKLAVPRLIDLLAVRDKYVREAALEALCSITAKHHGYRAARWRSWHAEHGHEPRIEWVIDGLRHRDVAVRRWAADELARVTGQRIPFPAEGDRRSRDLALRAWQAWWDAHRHEYEPAG